MIYNHNHPFTSPSIDQGYGRIELDNILYFKDQNNNPNTLYIKNHISISTNDIHHYCIKSNNNNNNNKLQVTLVWNDAPISINNHQILSNNIDLFIINNNSSQLYIGNQNYYYNLNNKTTYIPWDNINNVEKININNMTNNEYYSIHIRGTNIAYGTINNNNQIIQSYSLVISGNIQYIANTTICSIIIN